jgi:hypothetical protein
MNGPCDKRGISMPDARKFSRTRHRIKLNRRDEVEARLRSSILELLREEGPSVPPSAIGVIAEVAAVIASQLLAQTQTTHRLLKTLGTDIADHGTAFVEQMIQEARKDFRAGIRKAVPQPAPTIGDQSIAHDWAGPVAGPTLLERHFGIPRSTLYRWQKRNEVIWLNTRSSRKPVYPLRQFVDGRPEDGIGDVVQLFGDPRAAWQWLLQPNGEFDGSAPLDLLLTGAKVQVVEAARNTSRRRAS